ncbi:response regulator transcription factor [Sphingomonas cavernae]|uniref:DNA-binding response regulator n=1 Tax=Sphingomonas cavernae TaxID=2320861 RepID=A0A418WJY2_9SPHN|nr:response regulator [Sphingomonas cavernae]RJF90262.1 DNA-binding response regulator [Sphingomonas cavernae]
MIAATVLIMLITSRTDVDDIVTGLQAGADDYVIKPVDRSVLLARLEAIMRRAYLIEPRENCVSG